MKKGKVRKMKYIKRKASALVLALAAALSVFLTSGWGESVICLAEADAPEYIETSGRDFKISSRFWELLVGKNKTEEKTVLIGGTVFGAKVKQTCVTVQDSGVYSNIKIGDKLIEINGKEIDSARDVIDIVAQSDGEPLTLTLVRGDKKLEVKLTPKLEDGEYKLGLGLKDGAAGIGTVTYIDPKTGAFGGLGHGICDPESGEVIEIHSGTVTGVILGGAKRGEAGKPGELSGILTDKCVGTVYANTPCGVFGVLDKLPDTDACISVPVGHRSDVHTGAAVIYSTVKNGKTRKFDIEITELDTASQGTKSFAISVFIASSY